MCPGGPPVGELRWPELGDTVETLSHGAWVLAEVSEVGSISNAAGVSVDAFWVTTRPTPISAARGFAVARTAANHGELWRWPRPAAEIAAAHLAGKIPRRRGRR